MEGKVTLGYWGGRGLGQVPRLLLAYTGANWEDKQYTDHTQWFGKDKTSLGLDFPNLPYLLDGALKISDSASVCRHIVNRSDKKDLAGKSVSDQAIVNQIIGVITDLKVPISGLIYSKEWEKQIGAAWEKVKPKLEQLAKFFGDKEFALGYLTLVDFVLAENSYYVEKLFPEEYKTYPFLQKNRDAFNNLAEIKGYYASENSIKGPFTGGIAVIQF